MPPGGRLMGRIVSAIIVLAVLPLLLAVSLSAATVSVRIDVDASSVRVIDNTIGESIVSYEGMNGTNYFEFPSLPFRSLSVLIPRGEDVVSFRLVDVRTVELSGSVKLAEFKGMMLDDGTVRGVSLAIDEATGGDSVFPAWSVRHTGTFQWKEYSIATFEVYPVRYDLVSGRLTVDEDMTLVVETAPVEDEKIVATRLRHVDGFRESAEREVRKIVENPSASSAYIFDDIVVAEDDRGFLPAYQPGLEGSSVYYLIITDSAMEAEFQRLADWKTLKGIPAVVRTIEWIEQNYWSGADVAESVRNFIREAYEKWGIEYVLLGGDTDVITVRLAYTTFYTGDLIPTDMYFSCLDGTWNADGDSLWGEAFHSTADPGDDADLLAEVYVGRLPASTVDEARILVDKTIAYSEPADTAYKEDFLFLGEVGDIPGRLRSWRPDRPRRSGYPADDIRRILCGQFHDQRHPPLRELPRISRVGGSHKSLDNSGDEPRVESCQPFRPRIQGQHVGRERQYYQLRCLRPDKR